MERPRTQQEADRPESSTPPPAARRRPLRRRLAIVVGVAFGALAAVAGVGLVLSDPPEPSTDAGPAVTATPTPATPTRAAEPSSPSTSPVVTAPATGTPPSRTLPTGQVTVTPRSVDARRTVLVDRPWGQGPGEFGFAPGEFLEAQLGPSAVAVRRDRSVLLLDTVNWRVESFTATGTSTGTEPVPTLPGRTMSDLVVAPDTGRIYAVASDYQQAFLLGPGEHRWVDFGRASPTVSNSQAYYVESSQTVYVYDYTASRPVLSGDTPVPVAEQPAGTVAGVLTPVGRLEPTMHDRQVRSDASVVIHGPDGSLDVSFQLNGRALHLNWLPSDDGALWFHIGVERPDAQLVRDIVRYDPYAGSAVVFTVPDRPFHDTVHPLAVGGGRLVAIDGDASGGRLVAYDPAYDPAT